MAVPALIRQSSSFSHQVLPAPQRADFERMQDLLLEAIVPTLPHRHIAIERLLGDVVGDAAMFDEIDAADPASRDNDFDGLS